MSGHLAIYIQEAKRPTDVKLTERRKRLATTLRELRSHDKTIEEMKADLVEWYNSLSPNVKEALLVTLKDPYDDSREYEDD